MCVNIVENDIIVDICEKTFVVKDAMKNIEPKYDGFEFINVKCVEKNLDLKEL